MIFWLFSGWTIRMKCPGCRISIILITILHWTTGVIVTQGLGTRFPFMGELKHSGPCCWSSHCHMLLFCKTFCAINLSPSFGMLLPNTILPKYNILCILPRACCSVKLWSNKKAEESGKEEASFNFLPLSFPIPVNLTNVWMSSTSGNRKTQTLDWTGTGPGTWLAVVWCDALPLFEMVYR